MIPTRRHLQYASGFIELGMFRHAAKELRAINSFEKDVPEVLMVRIDLHMHAKEWKSVRYVAAKLTREEPGNDKGWISWAFALRELGEIKEARRVLLKALPLHGETCDVLHYNLACYECLLGHLSEAKHYLTVAARKDKQWKEEALLDQDLRVLWAEIRLM